MRIPRINSIRREVILQKKTYHWAAEAFVNGTRKLAACISPLVIVWSWEILLNLYYLFLAMLLCVVCGRPWSVVCLGSVCLFVGVLLLSVFYAVGVWLRCCYGGVCWGRCWWRWCCGRVLGGSTCLSVSGPVVSWCLWSSIVGLRRGRLARWNIYARLGK